MRPKIICHMISSIDGRLIVQRWSEPAAGIDKSLLTGHYDKVGERFEADGWIAGRKTMESLLPAHPRLSGSNEPVPRDTYVGRREGRGLAVILDPSGKINYASDELYGDHVVAVLGHQVSDQYLHGLQNLGISYLFAGEDGRDLSIGMSTLASDFGTGTLLLQGGGLVNGAMLKAGLIDEFSIIMSPSVDGLSGIPAIVDYVGEQRERPADGLALRFLDTEVLPGGMVWLHYAVEKIG